MQPIFERSSKMQLFRENSKFPLRFLYPCILLPSLNRNGAGGRVF